MNTRVREALQVLYEEGLKHYKPEYRDGANRWDAIGMAISEESDNVLNTAYLAYSHWENWNHHDACAVLDWIFPRLHDMRPFEPAIDYLDTLKRVQRAITRPPQKVFTDWNNEEGRYNVGEYALEVRLVEIKDSTD